MRASRLLLVPPLLLLSTVRAATAADTGDEWFGRDKALHFGASAALAAGGYGVAAAAGGDRSVRLGVGAGVALAAGVGKELWDLSGHGDPSWRDLTWDVIGTAAGLALSLFVDRVLLDGSSSQRAAAPDVRAYFLWPAGTTSTGRFDR